MSNLRKNENCILSLLECLKFLREDKKRLEEELEEMKLANQMNFEEKVSFALLYLNYFSISRKEMHDASCCHLEFCCIKFFCDEIFPIHKK